MGTVSHSLARLGARLQAVGAATIRSATYQWICHTSVGKREGRGGKWGWERAFAGPARDDEMQMQGEQEAALGVRSEGRHWRSRGLSRGAVFVG